VIDSDTTSYFSGMDIEDALIAICKASSPPETSPAHHANSPFKLLLTPDKTYDIVRMCMELYAEILALVKKWTALDLLIISHSKAMPLKPLHSPPTITPRRFWPVTYSWSLSTMEMMKTVSAIPTMALSG
jgi:hypothetical protein